MDIGKDKALLEIYTGANLKSQFVTSKSAFQEVGGNHDKCNHSD